MPPQTTTTSEICVNSNANVKQYSKDVCKIYLETTSSTWITVIENRYRYGNAMPWTLPRNSQSRPICPTVGDEKVDDVLRSTREDWVVLLAHACMHACMDLFIKVSIFICMCVCIGIDIGNDIRIRRVSCVGWRHPFGMQQRDCLLY